MLFSPTPPLFVADHKPTSPNVCWACPGIGIGIGIRAPPSASFGHAGGWLTWRKSASSAPLSTGISATLFFHANEHKFSPELRSRISGHSVHGWSSRRTCAENVISMTLITFYIILKG
jgi:hypothetical protein